MKQLTSKILSVLLCAAMLLSMAACGSSAEAASLGVDQVKTDVQEYLTTFVDESATVTTLYQSQNNISDTQTEISCQVAYTSDSGDGSGTVTLTYDLTDSGWTLSNCTADLASASAANPAAADTGTENVPASAAEAAPDAAEAAPDAAEPAQDTPAENTPAATEAPATSTPAASTSGATGTASTQSGALAGYTLTEVGTFENPSDGYFNDSSSVLQLKSDDSVTIYGPNGVVGEYAGAQSINGSDLEYMIVEAKNAADENCRGLVNTSGEEILDCEALWIDNIHTSKRFVEVYYSTGVCTQNDDYLLCLSTWGTNEKQYYTGYRKVFDLQTKSFVGSIELHDSTDINANETMVLVDDGDGYTLYDASGNVIKQSTAGFYLSETMATFRMDGCSYVLDVNGERWTTADPLYTIGYPCDFFLVSADSTYTILDGDGNEVLPGTAFSQVSDYNDGVFTVKNADETAYQLIDINGNILYEGAELPNHIINGSGWWYVSPSVGARSVIGTNGVTIEADSGTSDLTPNDSNGNYYILSTGETLALGTSTSRLTYGMVYARDTSGKYAVYDLFTGTALTEIKYSKVMYAGGYVYALDGSTWHAFQADPIYK